MREGEKASASFLPHFHSKSLVFRSLAPKSQFDRACPSQLGQLWRASCGVTLLVLLLYLPFIDNQLLDNEQVLVHLKDCLPGGGMA